MKLLSLCRTATTLFDLWFKKWILGIRDIIFSPYLHIGKDVSIELDKKAFLKIGKHVGLRNHVYISVRDGARVILEDNVFINNACNIVSHNHIQIGKGSKLGPNVLVFDHDYNYHVSDGLKNKDYLVGDIVIGNNCWIGAGSIILRNSEIGDNSVVAAGSVIKGKYPPNSIIVQKRVSNVFSVSLDHEQ